MKKTMMCPICRAANEVDESSVGCYVLCHNCPHRFYVPVPALGESFSDEPAPSPNVIPDYKAWDKKISSRDETIALLAGELRWQRSALLGLLAAQVLIGILVALVLLRT